MAKAVIVTGASGGIGQAIALRLAEDGFCILLNYAGKADKANETAKQIEAAGGKAKVVQGDVANPADMKKVFEAAKEAFGEVEVVVNCAGVMSLSPFAKGDVEIFDKVIQTNLRGTFVVLSEAVRHLREGGRIIALSSSVIAKAVPGYGAYIASKAGVEGLVHVLANELRGRKITVNAVSPGPVGTELFLQGKTQEQIQQAAQAPPLERLGEPEDVANLVSFLAGPQGAWINGQVVRTNGGFA